jgi:RHS repeat-associated protein
METSQFDGFGNRTELTITEQDHTNEHGYDDIEPGSTSTLHVTRTFEPTSEEQEAWLIGLAKAETIDDQPRCPEKNAPCTGLAKTRHAEFSYWPGTTLLKQHVRERDDPTAGRTTDYVYDDFGNLQSAESTIATGEKRSSTVGYDDEHLFPYSVTNRLGHVTQVRYNSFFGTLSLKADPNGIDEAFGYDEFGVLRRTRGPSGSLSIDYEPTDSHLGTQFPTSAVMTIPAAYRVIQSQLGGEISATEYDALGRVVQKSTTGLNGAQVTEEYVYDAAGRLVRATRPHLPGDPSQSFVEWTYDALDRPTLVKYPDGGEVQYAYASVVTVDEPYLSRSPYTARSLTRVTDANKHTRLIWSDRNGRQVRVTNAKDQDTDYRYGAFGSLLWATGPDGVRLTYDADAYGRVTSSWDPAVGGGNYTQYNGFDEAVLLFDAGERQTALVYDDIGRLVEKREIEGEDVATSQWIYDGAPEDNAVGRLIETISPSSQHAQYTYEPPTAESNRGLLHSVTRTLNAPGVVSAYPSRTFTTSYHYDSYSRLEQIDYPSAAAGALSVKYGFDAYGHETKAYNASVPSTVYWELLDANQGFRIKQERLGPDAVTQREYEDLTGRAKSIATTKGVSQIQNLAYTYDLGGNMQTRKDVLTNDLITYAHDEIDQLLSVVDGNGAVIESYEYNATSNRLSNRSGLGPYTYFDWGRDWLDTAGDNVYDHDTYGNVVWRSGPNIPGGSQEIDYTRFNLPSQIRTGEGSGMVVTDFAYDADMQRVVKKTGESITYYAGALYQATFNGDVASHRYRVEAGGRTVAELTLDESATDVAFVTRYLHDDVLGSTDTISGPATTTQRFSPFGESASGVPSAANPYGFTGQEHDTEFGLINMRGRIYDPVAHQFLSADPFIASSGVGFNRFAYVNNSPLNYTDPSGFVPYPEYLSDPTALGTYVSKGTAGVAPGVDVGAGAGVGAGWGGPGAVSGAGAEVTQTPGLGTAIGTLANAYSAANTIALEASGPTTLASRTVPTQRVGQAAGAGASGRAPEHAWGSAGQEQSPSEYKGDWREGPAPQLAAQIFGLDPDHPGGGLELELGADGKPVGPPKFHAGTPSPLPDRPVPPHTITPDTAPDLRSDAPSKNGENYKRALEGAGKEFFRRNQNAIESAAKREAQRAIKGLKRDLASLRKDLARVNWGMVAWTTALVATVTYHSYNFVTKKE